MVTVPAKYDLAHAFAILVSKMGKRAAEPASVGIVTSDAVQAGARLRKRLLLGFITLVVLGGLGAGGWYVWNKTPLLARLRPVPAKATVDFSKLSPTAAIQAAQAEVRAAQTSTEKQAAYTDLGDAYSKSGDTAQSSTAYQQALTYSPKDIPLLERLSRSYEDVGDTADAIKTLHTLIDTINALTPEQINATNLNEKDWLLSRYKAELKHETGDF